VATATIVSDAKSPNHTTYPFARKQAGKGALTVIKLLVAVPVPNLGPALTIVKLPVAVPVPTLGPAVDLIQLMHPTPLLHVHHTPLLDLIALTAVIGIERETMTVGVDHHHHHPHRIPPEGIFPPEGFDATFRTTPASASTIAGQIVTVISLSE